MQPRCSGTNKAGEQCRGKALPGSRYCLAHDPDRVVDMTEWRRQGGKAKSTKARAQKALPAEPMSPEELQAYLTLVFKGVLTGKIAPNVGNCLGALARSMTQVREATELEERLSRLEAAAGITERRTG